MQPSLRRARPIGQDLRPERSRDHERLSDPIVITRAKAGDPRALGEDVLAVVLEDALGLSFPEVSAASGLPVGSAKCYADRGRATLRTRLESRAA